MEKIKYIFYTHVYSYRLFIVVSRWITRHGGTPIFPAPGEAEAERSQARAQPVQLSDLTKPCLKI